jgi:hypothetical protein
LLIFACQGWIKEKIRQVCPTMHRLLLV